MRAFAAIVLAASVSSCILLVDSLPDGVSSTCHLAKDSGACSACIETSCSSQLDACCGDDACKGTLGALDDCADGDCASFESAATSGKSADLLACMRASCKGSCSDVGDGGSITGDAACPGCKTDCARGTDNCGCSSAAGGRPANSVSCTSDTFDNSICCGTIDWPNVPGGSCACEQVNCYDDGSGTCECYLNATMVGGTRTTSCFSGEGSCCLRPDSGDCICSTGLSCDGTNEVQVSSCDTSTFTCPNDSTGRTTKLSACSVP